MDRKFVERELTPAGPRRRGTPEAGARSVTVNLGESPLGWLHARCAGWCRLKTSPSAK